MLKSQPKKTSSDGRGDLLSQIKEGFVLTKSSSELKLDSLGPPPSFSPAAPHQSSPNQLLPRPAQLASKASPKKRPTAEPGRFQGIKSIIKKDNDDGVPDWKKRVVAGRQAKVQANKEKKEEEERRQQEMFEGVPEWKKKLMDKKRAEVEEKMKPQREKERQEQELRDALAAMPPWKQELFKKKNMI